MIASIGFIANGNLKIRGKIFQRLFGCWGGAIILADISLESRHSPNGKWMDRSTLAVFLIGVSFCFVSAVLRDRLNRLPFAEEAIVAGHLIHGDGFLSPYDASPGAPPSCYCAPIYPLIIAGAFRILGTSHAIVGLLIVNAISFGVIVSGVFSLARFYVSLLAGWIAVALLLVHPVLIYFITDWWDTYVALAIFVGLLVAAALPFGRRWRWGCVVMGTAMGLLSLTNASYALAYPLIVLIALRQLDWRRRVLGIGICCISFAIVLSPWAIRNFVAFDRFIPVRGGTAYYLWLGNQPDAFGWLDADAVRAGPAFDHRERAMILMMGEPAYFDLCGFRLKEVYSSDPEEFWARSARRLLFVFMSDPTRSYLPFPLLSDRKIQEIYIDRALLHGAVMLLGLAGMWTAWRLKLRCGWIFAAGILAEVPFIFSFGSDRYNLPMRVILLFFAAILIACVIQRVRCGSWTTRREENF